MQNGIPGNSAVEFFPTFPSRALKIVGNLRGAENQKKSGKNLQDRHLECLICGITRQREAGKKTGNNSNPGFGKERVKTGKRAGNPS